jgi:hypothetical protein
VSHPILAGEVHVVWRFAGQGGSTDAHVPSPPHFGEHYGVAGQERQAGRVWQHLGFRPAIHRHDVGAPLGTARCRGEVDPRAIRRERRRRLARGAVRQLDFRAVRQLLDEDLRRRGRVPEESGSLQEDERPAVGREGRGRRGFGEVGQLREFEPAARAGPNPQRETGGQRDRCDHADCGEPRRVPSRVCSVRARLEIGCADQPGRGEIEDPGEHDRDREPRGHDGEHDPTDPRRGCQHLQNGAGDLDHAPRHHCVRSRDADHPPSAQFGDKPLKVEERLHGLGAPARRRGHAAGGQEFQTSFSGGLAKGVARGASASMVSRTRRAGRPGRGAGGELGAGTRAPKGQFRSVGAAAPQAPAERQAGQLAR